MNTLHLQNKYVMIKLQALHRMREYERRLVEAHGETGDGQGASPVGLQHGARVKLSDATSSSAQDQRSEDSVSDVPVSVPHRCLQ